MEKTINAVNYYISQNAGITYARKIRKCLNISPDNRSKVNFISRNLKTLSEKGYITFEGKKSNRNVYKLPKEQIRIKEMRKNNNGKKED